MTIGAHQVPVLIDLCPVQRIVVLYPLIRIDVEPVSLLCVPGRAQCLQTATRKLDQVLLQRSDAKGVLDFKIGEPSFAGFSVDKEFAVLLKEPRSHSIVAELCVIEISP